MLKIHKLGRRFEPVAMIADRRVFTRASINPVLGSPTDMPTCRIAARQAIGRAAT